MRALPDLPVGIDRVTRDPTIHANRPDSGHSSTNSGTPLDANGWLKPNNAVWVLRD